MKIAGLAAALALAGCAALPGGGMEGGGRAPAFPGDPHPIVARIERGLDLASALAAAAAAAGAIDAKTFARARSTIAAARTALGMARAAADAGDRARAGALMREAEARLGEAAAMAGRRGRP
jgi:hypothetical protein